MTSGTVSVELIRWQMKDVWRMKRNVLVFLTAEDRNMAEITGAKPGQELIDAMTLRKCYERRACKNIETRKYEIKPARTQKPRNMK